MVILLFLLSTVDLSDVFKMYMLILFANETCADVQTETQAKKTLLVQVSFVQ